MATSLTYSKGYFISYRNEGASFPVSEADRCIIIYNVTRLQLAVIGIAPDTHSLQQNREESEDHISLFT
jgi:hypothetical protein